MTQQELERAVCAVICQADGIKAREIADRLGVDRKTVNQLLYASPLMRELCWQDRDCKWHGIVRQARPHIGLQEFAGYYDTVSGFLGLTEDEWLRGAVRGCTNIRAKSERHAGPHPLLRDCRATMVRLFDDLLHLLGKSCLDWEIAFELRLKRSRYVRIYADVLIITENRIFSLEFKMKDKIDPDARGCCRRQSMRRFWRSSSG